MTKPVAHPSALVPRLCSEVETIRTPEGKLHLRGPLLLRPMPLRWLAWLLAQPKRIEVELDDIGAWVVERCDGRSLDQLASDLAVNLKLTRREAETALADFVRLLQTRRLLRLDDGQAVEQAA